ncbi:MAG: hypothetical protein RJR37_14260 [Peptococcaceae bacterium MAG4]|nr:hypothetical protein [Peptococcaceae bacterium MAG4]
MAERVYTISEALEILKNSLEQTGLKRVNVTVNGHNLTPLKSALWSGPARRRIRRVCD